MSLSSPDLSAVSAGMSYSDINGMKNVTDIDKAAEQFESVFVGMWLKSVRDANKVFSEDNYTSSSGVEMHQEMLDKQWAIHIAENGGIGLKETIARQLGGQPQTYKTPGLHTTKQVLRNIDTETSTAVSENSSTVKERFVNHLNLVVDKVLENSPLNATAVKAQAILETGWGSRVIKDAQGKSSFNLFGVKADNNWKGETVTSSTSEYIDDQRVEKLEKFRRYESYSAAVADYKDLITESERYAQLVHHVDDAFAYADELQQAGYATDPAYANKVKQVIEQLRTGYGFAI